MIDEAVKEVKISPNPRAIEAASGAVKSLNDASKSLLDLHEKIRAINNSSGVEEQENENENIVIKSTLADLIKEISAQDEPKVKKLQCV